MMPTPTSGLSLHALSLSALYQLALRWALLKQILSRDPWSKMAPIPPPFMPHDIFVLTNKDFGHIHLHARVHRLCHSSEVSIPWYPTWLSFRQDIALWSNMGQLIPHSLWFFINVFFLLGHPGLPVLVSSANHGKTPCTKCLVITGDGFLPCPGKMHFQVLPTLKLVLSYWQWRSAS